MPYVEIIYHCNYCRYESKTAAEINRHEKTCKKSSYFVNVLKALYGCPTDEECREIDCVSECDFLWSCPNAYKKGDYA